MDLQFIQLTDLVELNVLEEIVDHFQKATGLTTMITDHQGRPIVQSGKFSEFCQSIRNMPECHQSCRKCDATAGMEASYLGRPLIYLCHAGIVDVASPILINGHYIGMIMVGQVVLSDEETKTLPQRTVYPPIDFTKYPEISKKREAFFNTFRRMTLAQLQAHSNLLFTIANYIAEIGYKKLMEQELNQQRLKSAEHAKEKALLSKKLAKHELKSVQEQLNPSFLLNTFNSIQRQAILEGAGITSDLLLSFSSILRRLLNTKDSLRTIRDELEYINNYVLLRNISAHYKIRFEADVPESLQSFELPTFVLQTLIENVLINHSEDNHSDYRISLSVHAEEDCIRFDLSNKNLILDSKTAEELSTTYAASHNTLTNATTLSVKNVIDILTNYYGNRFLWKCSSSAEQGTSIQLFIPK